MRICALLSTHKNSAHHVLKRHRGPKYILSAGVVTIVCDTLASTRSIGVCKLSGHRADFACITAPHRGPTEARRQHQHDSKRCYFFMLIRASCITLVILTSSPQSLGAVVAQNNAEFQAIFRSIAPNRPETRNRSTALPTLRLIDWPKPYWSGSSYRLDIRLAVPSQSRVVVAKSYDFCQCTLIPQPSGQYGISEGNWYVLAREIISPTTTLGASWGRQVDHFLISASAQTSNPTGLVTQRAEAHPERRLLGRVLVSLIY